MKIVDLQSGDNRKAYQTPLLKNLGEVKELTKSVKGSDDDEDGGGKVKSQIGGGGL